MNFSNSAFRASAPTSKFSDDTMSHANLVMACQWGWSRSPDPSPNGSSSQTLSTPSTSRSPPSSLFNNVRSKRFAPCQGRLYHQLLCSHRIRTDLVEDCGANCVEPFRNVSGLAFICYDCVEAEARHIWKEREAQHNASYPSTEQMTNEQYDQWYSEHRQLETEYAHDFRLYETDLKSKTRPSHICSALETSKEEVEFTTELDSLSLSLMGSTKGTADHNQSQQERSRVSLPNDASEQLYWDLNALALDRGSCGVEYSASRSPSDVPTLRNMSEEELWRKPRR